MLATCQSEPTVLSDTTYAPRHAPGVRRRAWYRTGLRARGVLAVAATLVIAGGSVGCEETERAGAAKARKARTLLEQGDNAAAVTAARNALAEDPNDPAALRLLAIALELELDYGEAASLYQRLLELEPEAHELRSHLARVLALGGRTGEARSAVAELRAADPKNLDGLLLAAALSETTEQRQQVSHSLDAVLSEIQDKAPAEVLLVRADLSDALGDGAAAARLKEAAAKASIGNANVALALATLYKRQDRLGLVEGLLTRVLEVTPDPQPIAMEIVEIALRREDVAGAKRALRKIKEGSGAAALMAHARVAMAEGRWQDALQQLEAAVPQLSGADQELARFNLAETLLALERFPDVERELRTLLDGELGYATAAMMLCDLLEITGRQGEVPELLAPIVAKHPEDPALTLRLGQSQLALGQADHALATFKKLTELDPKAPGGHYLQGEAWTALGKRDEAKAAYEQAMELSPGFLDALDALAAMAMKAGRSAEALALLEAELARNPNNAAIHIRVGGVLATLKRHDEAEAAYKRATEVAPASGPTWFAHGEYAISRGATARARELFRKGLEQDAGNVAAWLRLGDLAYRAGERGAALSAFEKVLALEPNLVAGQNNVAMVLAELQQDLERAEALARSAHASAPEAAGVADTLGWVLVLRDKADEALPLLRAAAEQLKSANAHYHVGMALMNTGDKAGARQAFARMLRTDRNHPHAAAVKAAMRNL